MERSNAYYATMQRKVGMSWKENNVVVLRKNKSQYYLKRPVLSLRSLSSILGKLYGSGLANVGDMAGRKKSFRTQILLLLS